MKIKKIIAVSSSIFVFLIAMTVGVGVFWSWEWLNKPLSFGEASPANKVIVEPGATLGHVAYGLKARGELGWPKLWLIYARLNDRTSIKVGEYIVEPSDTPLTLLNKLVDGQVVRYSVTFFEGIRFREMLAHLHSQNNLTRTLENKSYREIIGALNLEIEHPEGWFFPDTYQYVYGDSDVDILSRAHQKMRRVLADEWDSKADALPYTEPYQALIMASIIEKETGVPQERPDIAGVFVRRLNKNMRLQTDPTVIYGMGESYAGNITRKDLRTATPYNTYVISGLPPTPIAMPGREAIHAALHPKSGEALYFVAKGNGEHYFSSSLDEHNEAVRRFQKRRVENYRSSPSEKN